MSVLESEIATLKKGALKVPVLIGETTQTTNTVLFNKDVLNQYSWLMVNCCTEDSSVLASSFCPVELILNNVSVCAIYATEPNYYTVWMGGLSDGTVVGRTSSVYDKLMVYGL